MSRYVTRRLPLDDDEDATRIVRKVNIAKALLRNKRQDNFDIHWFEIRQRIGVLLGSEMPFLKGNCHEILVTSRSSILKLSNPSGRTTELKE